MSMHWWATKQSKKMGRNIFQGNRLLQDIIDYTEMEDEEGAIIFLDQQKAFDKS